MHEYFIISIIFLTPAFKMLSGIIHIWTLVKSEVLPIRHCLGLGHETMVCAVCLSSHDDVIKWKHFPRYWPFVREIHRSPVNFPHKGQWRGALMFTLICARINGWVNNHEAGDLRRNRAHCDVTVMFMGCLMWVQTWQLSYVSPSSIVYDAALNIRPSYNGTWCLCNFGTHYCECWQCNIASYVHMIYSLCFNSLRPSDAYMRQ